MFYQTISSHWFLCKPPENIRKGGMESKSMKWVDDNVFIEVSIVPEAALQGCSYKKVF